MKKLSKLIANHNILVLIITAILIIPSIFGMINTRINYDMLSYLPENLDSVKGQNLLNDVFSNSANSMLVIEGMNYKDIKTLKQKIEPIKAVEKVVWINDLVDPSIPVSFLPEDIQKQFFNKDTTMLIVQYNNSPAANSTQQAISEIRKTLNKQCFLSGMSAIIKDTKDLADKETPFYVLLAVIFSTIILLLSLRSYFVPPIFLVSIGVAILFNLGTNIIFGEISYVTKALAAVLQLGVTMDYSIFLLHRYDEEKLKFPNKKEAMAEAISKTIVSITGSSLTTIAGFLALCAMNLKLGKDIGLVMAKGVLIGVVCAVTVLPSLILAFDKPIHKYTHKTIIPKFNKISDFITKHYKPLTAIFLIAFVPFIYASNHAKVYYNLDESLPKNMESIVATNKLKDKFNMMTTHMILTKDNIPTYKKKELVSKIEEIKGMQTVLSYDKFSSSAVPDSFIPEDLKNTFKKENYNLILANSKYKAASDDENNQLTELTNLVKSYDYSALISGEGALTKDLILIADKDFKNVSVVSIIAIFLIVVCVFTSISIPVILVSSIELAIFINMGIPYFTGTTLPFIASIVIGTIQLGSTVDYAILLTSRYKEERFNGLNKINSAKTAINECSKSIFTSALTFFASTAAVALVSNIALIKSLCFLISRGALISMVVIIFILPSLLLVCDSLIQKTSLNWKVKPKKDEEVKAM